MDPKSLTSPELILALKEIADAMRGDRGVVRAAKYIFTGSNSGVQNYWTSFAFDTPEYEDGGITRSGIYIIVPADGNYQVNVSARISSGSIMPRVLVIDQALAILNGKGFGGATQPNGSIAHCAGGVKLKKGWSIVVQFGAGGTVNGTASLPGTDYDFAAQVSIALIK